MTKTTLVQANSAQIPLPDQSVHCVVTSPPYWGLRDYGLPGTAWPAVNYAPLPGMGPVMVGGKKQRPAGFLDRLLPWRRKEPCQHRWETRIGKRTGGGEREYGSYDNGVGPAVTMPASQFCRLCGIWRGCYGLEPTIDLYVAHTVLVFREVWRVLRDDGVLWLNLGDSYASAFACDRRSVVGQGSPDRNCKRPSRLSGGLKEKDLCAVPWRVALALQADGWYLRSDVVWHKTNCLPESVTDRPTKAHEYVFLLAKSARYFYDADAIRVPYSSGSIAKYRYEMMGTAPGGRQPGGDIEKRERDRGIIEPNPAGCNRRTVWSISSGRWPGAHFAVYSVALVEPCIKAGTSERGCCPVCGAQWERVTERAFAPQNDVSRERGVRGAMAQKPTGENSGWDGFPRGTTATTTTGWHPTCDHDAPPVPSLVLDPFAGSGTTLQVARQLGRRSVGLDLSSAYLSEQARARLELDRLDEWQNGKATEELSLDDLPLFSTKQ